MIFADVKLEKSVLETVFFNIRKNFYNKIDPKVHKNVYIGRYNLRYAEPEFTGKYLDICAHFYELDKDDRAKNNGKMVVDSIRDNQRADGYIGCLEDGNELEAFSVWNHSFTLYGLIRFYEATGDEVALDCANRAAEWLISTFICENAPDILNATNDGTQHLSSIFAMMQIYRVTKNKNYLDYVDQVLNYCETTDMNLVSFDSILNLRSRKGIEMLIIYMGVLEYGMYSDCEKAVNAAERYWQEIYETQIRNTGNATIRELWTAGGNAPVLLPTDIHPNENCVAVGWVEFSLKLFAVTGEAKYLDAIEQTLYNHLVGSVEAKGEDFAYYQGNFGKKEYRTNEGMYQCCRYRGFTLFTYLKDYIYHYNGETVIPMVYTASEFNTEGLSVVQKTEYPKSFNISFEIKNQKENQKIRIRIPKWCGGYLLTIDEEKKDILPQDGYVTVELGMGETKISIEFVSGVKYQIDKIDDKEYASFTFGPLLLAMDTHFSNSLWEPVSEPFNITREEAGFETVHFKCNQMHLVDFASAGKLCPNEDVYSVFIPVE